MVDNITDKLVNNDSELNNHESEGMNTSSFGYLCFLFDTKVFPTHDDFLEGYEALSEGEYIK